MTRVTSCVLLCASLLLGGCRLDGHVAVDVDGDGAGALAFTLGADAELRRAVEDADGDPLAALEETGRQLRGWSVTRAELPAGGEAVTLSTRFSDPAELERVSTEFADGLAAPELAPIGPMRLTVTDETLALEAAADLRVRPAVRELGLSPAQAQRRLTDGLELRVTVGMPGEVLRTNADERPDETTAVWVIAPGQRRSLEIEAARPWTLARVVRLLGTPAGFALLALVAGSVVGLAVLWRRRRPTAPAAAPLDGRDAPAAARAPVVAADGGDRRAGREEWADGRWAPTMYGPVAAPRADRDEPGATPDDGDRPVPADAGDDDVQPDAPDATEGVVPGEAGDAAAVDAEGDDEERSGRAAGEGAGAAAGEGAGAAAGEGGDAAAGEGGDAAAGEGGDAAAGEGARREADDEGDDGHERARDRTGDGAGGRG